MYNFIINNFHAYFILSCIIVCACMTLGVICAIVRALSKNDKVTDIFNTAAFILGNVACGTSAVMSAVMVAELIRFYF